MPTPKFALPYVVEGQVNAAITHNDAINRLDSLAQIFIIDRDLTAPPGSPAEGAVYLVKATGTGAWASHDNQLALYFAGWIFLTPMEGLEAWILDENKKILYNGSAWVDMPREGAAVADLALNVDATYNETQVQSIADKVDALLAVLRTADTLAP